MSQRYYQSIAAHVRLPCVGWREVRDIIFANELAKQGMLNEQGGVTYGMTDPSAKLPAELEKQVDELKERFREQEKAAVQLHDSVLLSSRPLSPELRSRDQPSITLDPPLQTVPSGVVYDKTDAYERRVPRYHAAELPRATTDEELKRVIIIALEDGLVGGSRLAFNFERLYVALATAGALPMDDDAKLYPSHPQRAWLLRVFTELRQSGGLTHVGFPPVVHPTQREDPET